MIRFEMLGEIGLRDPTGQPVESVLRQPKRLALLAYLASPAPGSWHRRDTVLALFWPELDAAHARTSLRSAIYTLRRALGDAVIISQGDERLAIDPALMTTDVADVRAALAAGDVALALAGYRGDLLAGLYPSEAPGFERWLDEARDRLRRDVVEAALVRSGELEAAGSPKEALAIARRLLDVQPDDERGVRRVMVLAAALGDPAGGLTVFEKYRLHMEREFEASPSHETLELAERLRRPGPWLRTIAPEQRAPDAEPAVAIAATLRAANPTPASPVQPVVRRHRGIILAAAGLAVVVALLGVRGWFSPAAPAVEVLAPQSVTDELGLQIEPAIAPNGRLVAYVGGSSQRMRIFVKRIGAGAAWPLSGDTTAVELLPRWSPDNDAILYLSKHSAWLASAVGANGRLFAAGTSGEGAVRSASWSPAGDSVLIVRHDSLLVLPRQGIGQRFVGRGEQLHSCAWSGDNRWIACVSGNWVAYDPGPLFGNRAPSGLVLFPVRGGAPIALTDRAHEHRSPAWAPDGGTLWFVSNRSGVPDEVHLGRIGRSGQFSGPVRRTGLEAEFLSVADDRLVYSARIRRANIWSVPMDMGRVVDLAAATRVTEWNRIIEVLSVARGGEWLVYDSDTEDGANIHRLSLLDGRVEQLTDDPRPEFAAELSPDGREVAYHLWDGGRRRLRVRRLADGAVSEPLPAPGDQGVPRWSADGQKIAFWDHHREPGLISVIARDTAGTWRGPLWTLDQAQLPIWSPDGREIAFVTATGEIKVIPADSGAVRTVFAPRTGGSDPAATFLAWDAARRVIWFIGHEPSGRGGIWWVADSGGLAHHAVVLRDVEGRANGPSLSHDGSRLYFTVEERLSNIRWAEYRWR